MLHSSLDPTRLAEAREHELNTFLKECKGGRRSDRGPENRVALAELEGEFIEIRKRWIAAGLIPSATQQELSTAA